MAKLPEKQLAALQEIAAGRTQSSLLTHYMLRTLRKVGLVKKTAIAVTSKGYQAIRASMPIQPKVGTKKPNLPEEGEPPTQDQIDEMIARLEEVHKKVVPHSMFGDDNCLSIEVMIEVLRDDLSDDEIYQREEDGDWGENAASHARDARLWLDGESSETDLADGWPLRKNHA